MANTTNLNLSKLAGTEKLKSFPSPYNDNMDAIDGAFGADFGVSGKPSVNAEINSLADGLAIIANGNTHAAITSGQFVYVRGHGTLADGLYQATANIAEDGTLSGSNLTADSDGGLNSVYSALDSSMANKANRISDVIQGNSSKSFDLTNKVPALVAVGRNSTSSTGRLALIDSWGNVVNLVTHTSYTLSMSGNTLTITNTGNSYASVLIIY